MATRWRILVLIVLGWALCSSLVVRAASFPMGEGIRVDSRVYVSDQREPVSQSTTIFLGESVYDYLEKPAEILVLERPRELLVLLDTNRRMVTEVPTQKVLTFCDSLRQRIQGQPDPFLRFLASPKFQHHEEGEATVTFNSPWMTYRVETVPAQNASVAQLYREFCDWYVRVNPMVTPSARPPFARLEVNAALAERGVLPREVHLTVTPKKGLWARKVNIRSEHQWLDRLGEPDLNRIAQTRQFMAIFSPVSLEQYARPVE